MADTSSTSPISYPSLDYNSSSEYLKSADLHNLGNDNLSIFSPDYITSIPGKIASWGVASLVSGVNSIYNSAVTVGNWFGAELSQTDTAANLSSIDSDLGKWYLQNKNLADISGFVVTSFAPGIGGVKLFNAGQKVLSVAAESGFVGSTLAKFIGLVPTLEQDIAVAGATLAKSQQTFKLFDANVLSTIASGFKQAGWESLAFEGLVQATMFKSPVLEGQDYKDITANILTGAALGGVIGGAINAATSYGAIKRVISAADIESKKYTLTSPTAYLQDPADRILVYANDLAASPSMETATAENAIASLEKRNTLLFDSIRGDVHKLVGGTTDSPIGNLIADSLQTMEPDQIANVVNGLTRLSRPGKNIKVGENEQVGYVSLFGEDTGKITWDAPPFRTIADRFESVGQIDDLVISYKWNKIKNWNMYTASGPEEVQARYMWAKNVAIKEGDVIYYNDIPKLEAALQQGVKSIKVENEFTTYTVDASNLSNEVTQAKRQVALELLHANKASWIQDIISKDGRPVTTDDISRAVNVSKNFLENDENASAFLRQDMQSQFDKWRKENGLSGTVDLDYVPSHFAATYKTDSRTFESLADVPNSYLQAALVNVKYTQKVAETAADNIAIGILGPELAAQAPRPTDKMMIESNRFGAGAGLFSFANGVYGSLASWAEQIGKVTSNAIKKISSDTDFVVNGPAVALRNNQAAAIEFSKINEAAARASGFSPYILNDSGDGLILKKIAQNRADIQAGKEGVEVISPPAGVEAEIKFINPEVGDAAEAHIDRNGYRVSNRNLLAQAQGYERNWDTDVFYPIKPDPKQMPFFAFVKDESVVGASQGSPTTMIHAASADDLQKMIDTIRQDTTLAHYKVYTKQDTERFFKAQQEYEFDRTLHENYIDSDLKSKGINSSFFVKSDPEVIVDQWLEWHRQQDSRLIRETMTTKLANTFDQLRTLGQQFTDTASSRYGVSAKGVEGSTQNPYLDYAKTALNISRLSEYPILTSINHTIENAVGAVWNGISQAYKQASFTESDLATVNAKLKEAGVQHAYKDAAEVLLANHAAPKPVLSNFIRTANNILASTFLRTDIFNALNNALGANVLLSAETTKLLSGIRNRNPAIAGELSQLLDISVPGTTDTIQSAGKLIAGVMRDYVTGEGDLAAFVKANGWSGRTGDMYRSMLEDLTLTGSESQAQMQGKLQTAWDKSKLMLGGATDKLSVISGNQLAEDFNRFVAAGVAKKISDLGVKAGLLDEATQLSYINTFVNRTQGNILASQRPLIFQGPIGQAIGLFQTFQFNTMQQLFRYISEGGPKDAAMLLGMQGTMYGLNGLPAFQYINQHIVGTASGNTNHTDVYSATYGTLGKTTGDWLMYGIPSNLLATNIYSRGDINPRRLTVIPVSPTDIVAVSAFGQFAGAIKDSISKMVNGGAVWESFLQGLEHNSLSRPLAGLAQALQSATSPGNKVFSTRNDGSLSLTNDLLSVATLSRLAGGKPLDEALANDEISRSLFYKANDKEKMKAADEAFRSVVIGEKSPPADAVNTYMQNFVKAGGQQAEFNKHMINVMTKVDSPRANQIIQALKGPYAQRMQALMGGSVAGFDPE